MEENRMKKTQTQVDIQLFLGQARLEGSLQIPAEAQGLVLFAHGSGSSRKSKRNQQVAHSLGEENIATFLFDLLTEEEEARDQVNREIRFHIPFLAERLIQVSEQLSKRGETKHLVQGFFGASTGAAAALMAAVELGPEKIKAIVSRGGRPDLAGHILYQVQSPTLLIVGGQDSGVLELNQSAYTLLTCPKKLEIIPEATHLFEERGALERVGKMAQSWFSHYF